MIAKKRLLSILKNLKRGIILMLKLLRYPTTRRDRFSLMIKLMIMFDTTAPDAECMYEQLLGEYIENE